MPELNSTIGFRQFPLALKLVVIWVVLLSLLSFWMAIDGLISTSAIKIGSFVAGAVYFYLAIDLAERGNISRIMTSIIVGMGTLVRLVLLVLMFTGNTAQPYIEYFNVRYPVSATQVIVFLFLNIFINLCIVYVLLRPSTKVLFFSTPSELTAESSSQKTL